MINSNSKKSNLITILLGTFILLLIGFYNGYPLVYSDTGTYIYSGFDFFVPKDRPIGYGLFIRFFSLNYSLWFVALIQNFITAFLIFEIFKLLNNDNFKTKYLITISFLTLCTGIGWYTNQIMPDFFTAILLISIFLLVFNKSYSVLKTTIISIILIYASITHFSHFIIGLLIILSITLIKGIYKKKLIQKGIVIPTKRLIMVGIMLVFSWAVVVPTINYSIESNATLSKGGHVFLLAHLNQKGILKNILKENCDSEDFKDCKLCQYKDNLPLDIDGFIWGGDFLNNTGGWIDSKEEYDKIIKISLTTPKYLFENIYKSFVYGFIQIAHNNVGEGLSAYNEHSAPYGQIHWRFNDELNDYLNSRQNKYGGVNLKFDTLITVQWIVISFSLILLIYFTSSSIKSKINSMNLLFLVFIIIGIFINSLVTAGLSFPYARYSSRIIWLLPLALIILIGNNSNLIKRHLFKDRS